MTSLLPSQCAHTVDHAPGTQLGQVVIFKNLNDITTAVTTCIHRGPCTGRAAGASGNICEEIKTDYAVFSPKAAGETVFKSSFSEL